jgi:SAM-dependent methyltransferase
VPNPYPDPFLTLRLDALASSLERLVDNRAVILDLGSGGRRLDDVISMEWVDWPGNSLRGDVLDLPFRDGCADLILSQAVLEHVTDPDRAMREMRRVLRPGGILYVEIAFMQPVHMEPWHYFNVTPHGLAWLLRDWDVEEQGTLGTFDMVLEWLHREVGSKFFRRTRWAPADGLYSKVAYGVYARARKPV